MSSRKSQPSVAHPTDLQKLIEEFETTKSELDALDFADKESESYVREAYRSAEETAAQHRGIISGNSRARRERQVKLANIQELLRPILFPMNEGGGVCQPHPLFDGILGQTPR